MKVHFHMEQKRSEIVRQDYDMKWIFFVFVFSTYGLT